MWAAQSGPGATGHLLALTRDYATVRHVSGGPLADSPLHRAWLADIAASYEAMLQLSLRAAELVGLDESRPGRHVSTLARVVLPLAKLACSRQGFEAVSQLVESFGGAGYCEDTGIPQTLRDVLVHCIWEGTGSVLALDVLRALRDGEVATALLEEIDQQLRRREGPVAARAADRVRAALPELTRMLDADQPQAARDLAWSLARTYQLALVVAHARWAYDVAGDARPAAASEVLAARPLLAPGLGGADEVAMAALALG
jgi:acyl-CoA dehydrogenase